MYEPSREPVETAGGEVEHRRRGEGERVKSKTRSPFSPLVNRARFDRDARRKITGRQREHADARVLCVGVCQAVIIREFFFFFSIPRAMNSTNRFTACFVMHPSLPPGTRSCAPSEVMATMTPCVFSKAGTAMLKVGVFFFWQGVSKRRLCLATEVNT